MVSLRQELFMTDPTVNCLFCRIIRGEIPAKKVHEDDHVFAFEDIQPQAPTHVLIIPKKHFAGLKEAQASDAEIIGRCHLAAAQIARSSRDTAPFSMSVPAPDSQSSTCTSI
jgi:diadenosine tetraphosphate (Ap4A) HIT family hydrolase